MELSSIFNAILFSSAMGTVVALLILAVKKIFKNVFDARWHYYIWFLLLIRLLIPYVGLKALLAYSTSLNLPTKELKQGSMLNQPSCQAYNISLIAILTLSKKHFRLQ